MGKLSIPTLGKKGNTEHPKVNAAIEALNAILGEENKVKGSGVEDGTLESKNLKEKTLERSRLAPVSFQTKRVSTPETGAGSKAKVTVTWPLEFADANYTVALSMNDEIGEAEDSFVVQRINEQTKSKVVVIVKNEGSGNRTGILHAMAWHD